MSVKLSVSWAEMYDILLEVSTYSLIQLSVIEQKFALKNGYDAWNASKDIHFNSLFDSMC